MKRRHMSVLAGVAVAAVAVSMAPAPAQAKPVPEPGHGPAAAANRDHDLPNPLGDALREKQREAIEAVIKGEAR